jgi:choline dehydrogenase-like flavoprotein
MTMMPWLSGLDFKLAALRYRHANMHIVLVRERDAGFVTPSPETGNPKVTYNPSKFDQAHLLHGILQLCRILYVQGALEIRPNIPAIRPFVRDGDGSRDEHAFEEWLKHVEATGTSLDAGTNSAHQMGSNRMSSREEDGVVDSKGRVWGVEDLYVADASVLPSATGVNPMVSVMAVCDWIGHGMVEEMKGAV